MRILIIIAFIIIPALSLRAQSGNIQAVNYDKLKTEIIQMDSVLYVVNFWATWCRPCIEELPGFMTVNSIHNLNPGFKMLLVSLDDTETIKSTVEPFVSKNRIDAKVILLDDPKRMQFWIPDINKSWTGSIPATVIYRNGKQLFFKEGQIEKEDLNNTINKYLQNTNKMK